MAEASHALPDPAFLERVPLAEAADAFEAAHAALARAIATFGERDGQPDEPPAP